MTVSKLKRMLQLIVVYIFIAIPLIYYDTICVVGIILLFVLCTINLFVTYYRTGVLRIFDPLNYFSLHYFLIYGVGYVTYSLRNDLGLSVYNHEQNIYNV